MPKRADFTDDFLSPPEERQEQRKEQFIDLLVMFGLSAVIVLGLLGYAAFLKWLVKS